MNPRNIGLFSRKKPPEVSKSIDNGNKKVLEFLHDIEGIDWAKQYVPYGSIKITVHNSRVTLITKEESVKIV